MPWLDTWWCNSPNVTMLLRTSWYVVLQLGTLCTVDVTTRVTHDMIWSQFPWGRPSRACHPELALMCASTLTLRRYQLHICACITLQTYFRAYIAFTLINCNATSQLKGRLVSKPNGLFVAIPCMHAAGLHIITSQYHGRASQTCRARG